MLKGCAGGETRSQIYYWLSGEKLLMGNEVIDSNRRHILAAIKC